MLTIFWSHYTNENILLEFQIQDIFVYFMISYISSSRYSKMILWRMSSAAAEVLFMILVVANFLVPTPFKKLKYPWFFEMLFFLKWPSLFSTPKRKKQVGANQSWWSMRFSTYAKFSLATSSFPLWYWNTLQYNEVILVTWLWNRCQSGNRDNQQCSKRLLSHT